MINNGRLITTTVLAGTIKNSSSTEELTDTTFNLDHQNTNKKNASSVTMIWTMIRLRNVKKHYYDSYSYYHPQQPRRARGCEGSRCTHEDMDQVSGSPEPANAVQGLAMVEG